MRKTIVCLANSWKNGGRCIAGREWKDGPGDWVRPVSTPKGGSLKHCDSLPVLGLFKIDICRHVPRFHQQENYQIEGAETDAVQRIEKKLKFSSLERILDVKDLWVPGTSSGSDGDNDRIEESQCQAFTDSLRLIRPEALETRTVLKEWNGRTETRALFRFNGVSYNLKVTDPTAEPVNIFETRIALV